MEEDAPHQFGAFHPSSRNFLQQVYQAFLMTEILRCEHAEEYLSDELVAGATSQFCIPYLGQVKQND